MQNTTAIELPEWISNDETKTLVGLSPDHLKRLARSGELVSGHHFMQLGKSRNSKYRWHLPHLIEHFSSRKLPARPQKSS